MRRFDRDQPSHEDAGTRDLDGLAGFDQRSASSASSAKLCAASAAHGRRSSKDGC